jgi:hypothetical protein
MDSIFFRPVTAAQHSRHGMIPFANAFEVLILKSVTDSKFALFRPCLAFDRPLTLNPAISSSEAAVPLQYMSKVDRNLGPSSPSLSSVIQNLEVYYL